MEFGRILFYGGVFLVLMGALLMRFPNLLSWFGKLPGDIRYQGGKLTLSFPLVSMIIVSLVLTLGINLVAKLMSGK